MEFRVGYYNVLPIHIVNPIQIQTILIKNVNIAAIVNFFFFVHSKNSCVIQLIVSSISRNKNWTSYLLYKTGGGGGDQEGDDRRILRET